MIGLLVWSVIGLAVGLPYRSRPVSAAPIGGRLVAADTAYSKRTYVYKTVKDHELHADVHRIANDTAIRPALIWIHGGALIYGSRTRGLLPAELHRFLNAGYVVVTIDYRLAPETKLDRILEDVQDAYRWVRTRGRRELGIDPDRIGLVGRSAGGYLTETMGFKLEPRPAALVSFYGYGDIDGPWYSRPDSVYLAQPLVSKADAERSVGDKVLSESIGPAADVRDRYYVYLRQQGLWPNAITGHDPAKEPKRFERYNPIRNVTKRYPPLLLLHGDQDRDVPYQQSVAMAAELERHGVPHDLITMIGRGHGFNTAGRGLDDPATAAAYDRVLQFLREYLKP